MISNYTISFFGNEKKYISECLDTKWISTNGKFVEKFSSKLKKFLKTKYVVPLNSGTAALHLALKAINIEKNDEVIVPTVTFIASVNAISYCNASPIFIDVDDDFIIDEKKVIKFLNTRTVKKGNFTINKKTKKKIKAIVIVNTWGFSKNLKNLKKICKTRNIKIIEDAAESIGSEISKNKFSGTFGDVSCFSFNANKVITAGGGGALITNNKKIADKAYYLSIQAKDNSKYFIHNDIGYNYRMTNLHAAIGLAQLEKIHSIMKIKKNISSKYLDYFKNIKKVKLLYKNKKVILKYNCWMNIITINKKNFNLRKLIEYMEINGVDVRPIWKLNHLQNKYKNYENFEISNAVKLSSSSICLPSSTNLSSSEINKISNLIKSYLTR